jgi:Tol biopolymer transport system component
MKNIPGNIFLVLVLFILTAAGCKDGSTNPPFNEVKITQITDYPEGVWGVIVAHNGSFMIYAVNIDTVIQIIRSDIYGDNKRVITTFSSLSQMLLSKDDSKILYGSYQGSNQFVFYLQDLNTEAISEVIGFDVNLNPLYYAVDFSNDNKAVLLGAYHISILDLETKTVKKVNDDFAFPIAFTPSGNEILFNDGHDSKLYKVNIDGSSRMALSGDYSAFGTLYSPDGNHIYFSGSKRADNIKNRVWKMNTDGSNITVAAGGKEDYGLTSISPDGRTLLLYSYSGNYSNSYMIIKTGSYEKKLTEPANNEYGLSFTNKPGEVLFIRHNMYISNIFLAEFPPAWLEGYTP